MPIHISGRQMQIIASEQAFPEFPDLLYGTTSEGISFFDAQAYLQKHKPSSSVEDFFTQYEVPIRSLMDAYGIEDEKVCVISKDSHTLVDSSLVYLFIAFVEPNFLAYMCDRIQEMFSSGICVSDQYLYNKSRARLSKEVIQTMNDEKDKQ